jgi:Fur family peroxide stress response transcriptional regulator
MSIEETRFETMLARLREHKFRITPQRLAVLRILSRCDGHPSVETIYERVKEDFPTTSLATVYKTVALLKHLGEVLELGFPEGGNRYDGRNPFPHPHLICTKCGRIEDPKPAGLADLTQQLTSNTGFHVVSHRLDFFGLCSDCWKKQS